MARLTRGERFKDARIVHNQHKKQTMDEVSAATGVSKSLIQALEDDSVNRSVGYDKVARLAIHYNVTTDYLLGLSDDPAPMRSAVDDLGLSPKAITWLLEMQEFELANDLSTIFENRSFQRIVHNLIDYVVTVEAESIARGIWLKHFPPGNDFDRAQYDAAYKRYLENLDEVIANCDIRHDLALSAYRSFYSADTALIMSLSGFIVDDDGFSLIDLSENRINRHLQNLLQELNRRSVEVIANGND